MAILKVVKMPRSTYYYYVNKLNSGDKYKNIKEEIQIIY